MLTKNSNIGIQLFMPGFKKNDMTRTQIAYLLLDNALGEYDVETNLGLIQILRHFRNYRGPIKIARCGFPWEENHEKSCHFVYTNCETAIAPSSPSSAKRYSLPELPSLFDQLVSNLSGQSLSHGRCDDVGNRAQ